MRQLYVSDPAGGNLRPLTPEDATVLGWHWDYHTKELFIGVRRDTNGDSQYTDEDGADLLVAKGDLATPATPVIDPAILKTLLGVLH